MSQFVIALATVVVGRRSAPPRRPTCPSRQAASAIAEAPLAEVVLEGQVALDGDVDAVPRVDGGSCQQFEYGPSSLIDSCVSVSIFGLRQKSPALTSPPPTAVTLLELHPADDELLLEGCRCPPSSRTMTLMNATPAFCETQVAMAHPATILIEADPRQAGSPGSVGRILEQPGRRRPARERDDLVAADEAHVLALPGEVRHIGVLGRRSPHVGTVPVGAPAAALSPTPSPLPARLRRPLRSPRRAASS